MNWHHLSAKILQMFMEDLVKKCLSQIKDETCHTLETSHMYCIQNTLVTSRSVCDLFLRTNAHTHFLRCVRCCSALHAWKPTRSSIFLAHELVHWLWTQLTSLLRRQRKLTPIASCALTSPRVIYRGQHKQLWLRLLQGYSARRKTITE